MLGYRDNGGAKEIPFTRVSAQVRLKALLAREDPAAVGALDATRRRTALLHEIRECVGARPAAPVALATVAGGRPAVRATAARIQTGDMLLPVLRRGARAARAEVYVARLLSPVPRVERRVAHRRAAVVGLR